jgi:transposase-like protein
MIYLAIKRLTHMCFKSTILSMEAPETLQSAISMFSDPQRAFEAAVDFRWPGGKVTCPRCGGAKHSFIKTRRIWFCYDCKKQFTVKVGTIFEDSPLGLDKWMVAIWMLANCKNGISSYELGKVLGIRQNSAWFMLHRIREAMKGTNDFELGGEEGGPVEADESWIGGEPKNRHYKKRLQLVRTPKYIKNRFGFTVKNPEYKAETGTGTLKTPVFGLIDRERRQARARVVPDVNRETLQAQILKGVSRNSTVYTDENRGYASLKAQQYIHEAVNHTREYVRGEVHTNGIENFWSLLKRTLRGTYVAVEPFHLDRYLDEQVFRYNNRKTKDNPLNDNDRFAAAMAQVAGKRLTYAELTGKGTDTVCHPEAGTGQEELPPF